MGLISAASLKHIVHIVFDQIRLHLLSKAKKHKMLTHTIMYIVKWNNKKITDQNSISKHEMALIEVEWIHILTGWMHDIWVEEHWTNS